VARVVVNVFAVAAMFLSSWCKRRG
jgi:hypothetical protein